jgi:tetratricopeptide (TPR) repeat protein
MQTQSRSKSRCCLVGVVIAGLSLGINLLGVGEGRAQQSELLVPTTPTDESANSIPGSDESKYKELLAARQVFAKGEFDAAERQLERAKEKYPELPPADVLMAKLYSDANNPAEARRALEKAVRDDADDPEAFVIFGSAALQERRFTDADLLFQRAYDVCSKYAKNAERKKNLNIRALDGLAAVAEAREDHAKAESYLKQLAEADPKNFNALLRLGRTMFLQKREEDAYKVFGDAYNIDKTKVPRPEVSMARLYQGSKDDTKAKGLMDLAKQRDPESLATRLAIAQWALETGRKADAEEALAAVVKIAPNDYQVLILQGIMARINADFPAAEKAFAAAHLLNPQDALVLNQLAIALVEQEGDEAKQRAVQYAQMAANFAGNRDPMRARESQVVFAWILTKLNRLPLAVQQLQIAMRTGGVGEDIAYYAAKILFEAGQTEPALELLNRSLDDSKRLFPNRSVAQELRATILSGKK